MITKRFFFDSRNITVYNAESECFIVVGAVIVKVTVICFLGIRIFESEEQVDTDMSKIIAIQ